MPRIETNTLWSKGEWFTDLNYLDKLKLAIYCVVHTFRQFDRPALGYLLTDLKISVKVGGWLRCILGVHFSKNVVIYRRMLVEDEGIKVNSTRRNLSPSGM